LRAAIPEDVKRIINLGRIDMPSLFNLCIQSLVQGSFGSQCDSEEKKHLDRPIVALVVEGLDAAKLSLSSGNKPSFWIDAELELEQLT
jgi:hypothetical protein